MITILPMQDNSSEKIRDDLEALLKDFKSLFTNLRQTVSSEMESKKEDFKKELGEIQDSLSKEPSKSGMIRYLTVAFIAGIVIGSLIRKGKHD
jgi:ElaB/YqjD/DUF883 family membrane-anchored ribosome-binding protein